MGLLTWPLRKILEKLAPVLIAFGILSALGYGDDIVAFLDSIFGKEETEPKEPEVTEATTLG